MQERNKTKTNEQRVAETWKQYQDGLKYLAQIKLNETIKQNVDFYEGRQWANVTERTKFIPRPVINIIRMIVNNKESAMNNKACRIVYEADTNDQDTSAFTKFADYQQKEMLMDLLDKMAVHSGAIKGTYIYHSYWDAQGKGKRGKVTGAMRTEILDPRTVIFANPAEQDEQKQKWIIIATREEVDAVRDMVKSSIDKEKIIADEDEDKARTVAEHDGTKLVTVLTKYFKVDGEVYCEKSTKNVIIRESFPLRPDYEKTKADMFGQADEANAASPDDTETSNKESAFSSYKPTLYPIAVGQYIPREDSIYGISEVEGLINNQKSINLLMAMHILQVQQESWSKWVVKDDALRGQTITNEPGQVLKDYSKSGNGIMRVGGGQTSTMPLQVLDNFISYVRTVTGSTEVMNGEAISANMSGAAIAQLQSQAQQPIEELRKAFWRVKEKLGRILEQFYRMYYHEPTTFTDKVVDENTGKPVGRETEFSARMYENTEFTVIAKACAGTTSSPAGDIAVLDALRQEGLINTLQWLEGYPEDALSDKDHLIELVKQAEASEINALKQQIQEREQQLTESLKLNEEAQKAVAAVSATNKENEALRKEIAVLYNKLRQALNEGLHFKNKANEYYSDAALFANELGNGLAKIMSQYNIPTMDEDVSE